MEDRFLTNEEWEATQTSARLLRDLQKQIDALTGTTHVTLPTEEPISKEKIEPVVRPETSHSGVVTGYRRWTYDGKVTLRGQKAIWRVGDNSPAVCNIGGRLPDHERIPDPLCKCGFYLVTDRNFITGSIGFNPAHQFIYGKAEGFGKVIKYSEGYRTEFARIKELYIFPRNPNIPPQAVIEAIAAHYGVPTIIFSKDIH